KLLMKSRPGEGVPETVAVILGKSAGSGVVAEEEALFAHEAPAAGPVPLTAASVAFGASPTLSGILNERREARIGHAIVKWMEIGGSALSFPPGIVATRTVTSSPSANGRSGWNVIVD